MEKNNERKGYKARGGDREAEKDNKGAGERMGRETYEAIGGRG